LRMEATFDLLPDVSIEGTCPTGPSGSWGTKGEYSTTTAINNIDDFVKQWNISEQWLRCTDDLGDTDEEFSTLHNYRVRFSIPTKTNPIPRASASVYFFIRVSKTEPANYPVEVVYQVEGNRLVFQPGRHIFREKWLHDVLRSKQTMLEHVDF